MSRVSPTEELKGEISLNYQRMKEEPQGRNKYGILVDVMAKTFEGRMNTALEEYFSICQFTGGVALELYSGRKA